MKNSFDSVATSIRGALLPTLILIALFALVLLCFASIG
jgi:hypothetical protein